MLTTLRQYYRGGRYDFLLNSAENIDLLSKRFIVFEIDSIKENKELFPVVTIIIMEAFINKMRRLKGVRKQLIVEEAWKALSTANMAEYLKYMYIFAAIINVGFNYVFIPIWGASGAALASLITQIFTSIILPYCIKDLRPNAKLMLEAIFLRNVFSKPKAQVTAPIDETGKEE